MSFARLAAVVAAGWMLWCATAAAGGPLRPFKEGFWSGGAYVDERTGAFTHCSAGVAYEGGTNLFVLVTGGYRWWLGLINPKWQLTPNPRAAIKLALDDGAPVDGRASIPNGQLLLVSLPDSSKLLGAFRHSSKLALDAEGQTYSFRLNGTPAVMDRLANCVQKSLALAGKTPPKPASPAAAPAVKAAAGASDESAPVPGSPAATREMGPAASVSSAGTAAAAELPAPAARRWPMAAPASATLTAAAAASRAASGEERTGEPATGPLAVSAKQPAPSAADPQEAAAPSGLPGSATAPLAFTSAPPLPSPPPGMAIQQSPPAGLSMTALEEVRLATDFVTKARLPDARLVIEDKPAALADFNAVWRSKGGAGAVKIILPGRDLSGNRIASDLIAVDPQLCKGNFSAARFRTDVDNRVVFSAVLSCSEANEDRETEYFVTPRHRGGFVVFAIIRSKAASDRPGFDWQKIDMLSRAAIEAAEAEG